MLRSTSGCKAIRKPDVEGLGEINGLPAEGGEGSVDMAHKVNYFVEVRVATVR